MSRKRKHKPVSPVTPEQSAAIKALCGALRPLLETKITADINLQSSPSGPSFRPASEPKGS